MSLSTTMLRVLLAKGVDPETILEVSEAVETEKAAADEERRAKRREANRRRQKAWYDRNVRDNASNAVISCDNEPKAVMQREDGEDRSSKKVLEPKKLLPEVINSSTPSGSQVLSPSKPRRHDWPADYRDQFWVRYPRKTDRKKAIAALDRVHRADRVPFAVIIAGVSRMAASGLEDRFVPHATTFLNNERWNDEWPKVVPRGARQGGAGSTADFWAGTAIDGNEALNGGRHDTVPFDTDERSWHRARDEDGGRSDEPPSQQVGADPWRLPALRVVGGR